ncbi:MAG: hypothetical protein VKK42_19635, partial [Lyngbya sp.]|nr:hypothetical protein [Lyngbya sp.]
FGFGYLEFHGQIHYHHPRNYPLIGQEYHFSFTVGFFDIPVLYSFFAWKDIVTGDNNPDQLRDFWDSLNPRFQYQCSSDNTEF